VRRRAVVTTAFERHLRVHLPEFRERGIRKRDVVRSTSRRGLDAAPLADPRLEAALFGLTDRPRAQARTSPTGLGAPQPKYHLRRTSPLRAKRRHETARTVFGLLIWGLRRAEDADYLC